MTTDAQPADSSPAPSSPATFDLGTLSTDERTEWRLSGKLPDPKATPDAPPASPTPDSSSPADSTPAEPVEQVASTDASSQAASEPAAPKQSKADARFQELLADRAKERDRADKAERELTAVRAQQTKSDVPASSPASATEFPEYEAWQQDGHPDAPWEDYLFERFRYNETRQQDISKQLAAQEQFTRTATERVSTFTQRYNDAALADASLPTKILPRLFNVDTVDACLQSGKPVAAINAVAQEILESPVAVKLLVHLSEHPDELDALEKLSPAAVIRRMAKLEAQLDSPAIPPPKTISSAPALTTTLGSRPAVPGDALKAAEKSGDFPRFRELANARDMAAAGIK